MPVKTVLVKKSSKTNKQGLPENKHGTNIFWGIKLCRAIRLYTLSTKIIN